MVFKTQQFFSMVFFSLLFINCSSSQETIPEEKEKDENLIVDKENIQVEKKYDAESSTYYYLTRVNHEDKNGKLLKLEHSHANTEHGETVPDFAERIGTPTVAINASMGRAGTPEGVTLPTGVQIIDGTLIQDLEITAKRHTLGIKDNNELVAYPPGVDPQVILDDGIKDALTAFTTLIEDHEPVSEDVLSWVGNYSVKHPRQVIAQFDNLDLLIFSCGGRGYGGEGMTALDVIRILEENGVKFAFMLDGGGSVSTVVQGELITPKIDASGTKDRPRSNFLYVQ